MKSKKIFKMTPNKTLIFALLALSACGKHTREDEPQQKVYQNSQQSLFDPYIAQGSIFTREVKNMPLATNSAAIAAYMPKMPAEYLPERFKKTVLTTLSTTSYNIPIYVVDSNNPFQEYANFESKDNRVIYKTLSSIPRGVFLCLNMHNRQAEGINLLLFMTEQQG